MKKKIFILITCLVISVSIVSCRNDKNIENNDNNAFFMNETDKNSLSKISKDFNNVRVDTSNLLESGTLVMSIDLKSGSDGKDESDKVVEKETELMISENVDSIIIKVYIDGSNIESHTYRQAYGRYDWTGKS